MNECMVMSMWDGSTMIDCPPDQFDLLDLLMAEV